MNSIEIEQIQYTKLFSVCTLVTDKLEYEEMKESFYNAGFNAENTEFLYIDNSIQNKYDAYSGLNKFLNMAQGKYIILCHQDILLKFDNLQILLKRITEIDSVDSTWGILANVGYSDFNTFSIRLTDPWGDNRNSADFPKKVKTVDENFMLIKNDANLALSSNISGFHLYGTDLCIIAEILGYSTYIIDFHLLHKSGGNANKSFQENKQRFITKYKNILSYKFLRTPVTGLFISNNALLNRICNKKICFSFKKRIDKIKEITRRYL